MKKLQLLFIVAGATLFMSMSATAQTHRNSQYNEEDKEDLRAFMRQGTNFEELGLSTGDTLKWYLDDTWLEKLLPPIPHPLWGLLHRGIDWIETDSQKRIEYANLEGYLLEGNLKFNSPALEHLDIFGSHLTGLDVTQNLNLLYLNATYNNLTELDVSQNIKLLELYCGGNNLSELDVTQNAELYGLYCFENNLAELDLSNNTKLGRLTCDYNNLAELDVRQNLELWDLWCSYNNFIELDVSNNIYLKSFNCSGNNLTELDVSNNTILKELHCYENNLTELDFSNNDSLDYIRCYSNKLKFSTLPPIVPYQYIYHPQDTINGGLKEYTDTIDLSSEYEINGHITNYEWFDITDGEEKEIEQPTNDGGIFAFTEEHKGKKLRCKMINAQFDGHNMHGFMNHDTLVLVYETDIINGISDNSIATHFTISPNPVSGEDATASFGLLESGEITIEVCDLIGECFYNITNFYDAGDHSITLDIKGIPSGSYICRMLTKGKQIGTEGFVVGK